METTGVVDGHGDCGGDERPGSESLASAAVARRPTAGGRAEDQATKTSDPLTQPGQDLVELHRRQSCAQIRNRSACRGEMRILLDSIQYKKRAFHPIPPDQRKAC